MVKALHILIPILALALPMAPNGSATDIVTISGTVTDAKTGETMPGVNVYFSETTLGAATDGEGRYAFRTEATGRFELVFSFIGYERRILEVNISGERDLTYDVKLQPKVTELETVEVVSSNREWKRNLEIFKKEFIGTGRFADRTYLLNPTVLDFATDPETGDLSATASEPLVLENHALGYIIYLELDAFQFDNRGTYGHFNVYPKFTEVEAPDERTRRSWKENRETAYTGSFQHFLNSLYHNLTSQRGFEIRSTHDLVPLTEKQVEFELFYGLGVDKERADEYKGFRLHREVMVIYGQKSGYVSTRVGGDMNVRRSTLFPARESGLFFVDANGNLLNPQSLTIGGGWFSDRMSLRLPQDYGR